jgi:ABC-type multidrug transport system fused ATPase/permease subunit
MGLVQDTRQLYKQLRQDPESTAELKMLGGLATSTLRWTFLVEALQMAQIYPVKLFFDGFGHRSITYLTLVSAMGVALYVMGSQINRQMERRRTRFFWQMWSFLWGYGHRRQLQLSVGWHTAHSTGEKESLLERNISRVQNLIDVFVFETGPVIFQVIITIVVVSLIDWRFGLLALITTGLYAGLVMKSERHLAGPRQAFREQIKHIEQSGTELTQNWRTIKQFGLEDQMASANWSNLRVFAEDERQRTDIFLRLLSRQEWAINMSRGGLYWLLGLVLAGVSLGTAVLVASWMERIYSNLYRFSDFQRRMNEGQEALRELVELLQVVPEVRQAEQPLWPSIIQGKVEFDRVSFAYPGGKDDALSELSLTVEPNQTVALVGYSGSGKSTLASLLLREYDPTSGVLRIDGLDMRQIDYDRYRQELVAVVSQEVKVFDTTVRQNIRMVAPNAPIGAEEQAAQAAYADQFIRLLPQGYETPVGENGVRLSGGQKQRLAIARALLRQPRILILDEATSALDAHSQKEIQETIDRLIATRMCTIFVIAHRFSTIMSADMVVVLKDGRISETGTHEELSRGQGIYRELRTLEMQGVLAEGE